jgi:hypothetical protein
LLQFCWWVNGHSSVGRGKAGLHYYLYQPSSP